MDRVKQREYLGELYGKIFVDWKKKKGDWGDTEIVDEKALREGRIPQYPPDTAGLYCGKGKIMVSSYVSPFRPEGLHWEKASRWLERGGLGPPPSQVETAVSQLGKERVSL